MPVVVAFFGDSEFQLRNTNLVRPSSSFSNFEPFKIKQIHIDGLTTTNDEFINCDAIIVCSGYKYDFSFLGNVIELSDCNKKGDCSIYTLVPNIIS